MKLDELRLKGIQLYKTDAGLKYRGPEGSKEIVATAMRERVQMMLGYAKHLRPEYKHAAYGSVQSKYGSCELCYSEIAAHESGTCLFCAEVIRRALALDDDAHIVFYDTETTGLTPGLHGVIEYGFRVYDRKFETLLDTVEVRMPLSDRFAVTEEALRINGYTPEKWRDAIPHEEGFALLNQKIRPHDIVLGWNMSYDVNMTAGTARLFGMESPIRRWADMRKIVEPQLRGKVPNMKLVTVTSFLGIDHSKAHTAMGDVDPMVEVWRWYRNNGGM